MDKEIFIDGVDFRKLLQWMNIPQKVDKTQYEQWKIWCKTKVEQPRTELYLRGADFSGYWKCPRRLWYQIHCPKTQKSMISKAIFTCEVRHQMIEDYLEKHGWKGEHLVKRTIRIGRFKVPCHGHIDALSPSNIILDIKHKFVPTDGDLLQTGFYQKIMRPTSTNIVLLYPSQIKYVLNLDKLMEKYMPRVFGCVAFDIIPPVHPDFPNCYYNCEYYRECGRVRTPTKKEVSQVWNDWISAISSVLSQ